MEGKWAINTETEVNPENIQNSSTLPEQNQIQKQSPGQTIW